MFWKRSSRDIEGRKLLLIFENVVEMFFEDVPREESFKQFGYDSRKVAAAMPSAILCLIHIHTCQVYRDRAPQVLDDFYPLLRKHRYAGLIDIKAVQEYDETFHAAMDRRQSENEDGLLGDPMWCMAKKLNLMAIGEGGDEHALQIIATQRKLGNAYKFIDEAIRKCMS